MQNAQTELSNVTFKHNLHLPDPLNSDREDGLSLEHFPVGLHFFYVQGETRSVHDKSPHQTQAFSSKLRHGHVFPSWVIIQALQRVHLLLLMHFYKQCVLTSLQDEHIFDGHCFSSYL